MTMPTNTPRSIAEALSEAVRLLNESGYHDAADELQALATANGAEAGEAGVEAAKWAYQRRAIRSTGGRVLNHHEALKDALHAYALATRPQAASDGEDGRRYRWLRDAPSGDKNGQVEVVFWHDEKGTVCTGPDLDDFIDAAMTTDAAKGEG